MSVGTPAPHQPPPGAPRPSGAIPSGERSRRRRWLPTVLPGLVVIAIVLWTATSSAIDDVEAVQPTAAITGIVVDIDSGAIRFASGDGLQVDVARQAGRFAGTPTVTTETTGGMLRISGDCPTFAIGRCDTSVTLTVPTGATLDLATDAGPIDGMITHGTVRASTAAGPITLEVTEDVDELDVTTAAGTIDLMVPDAIYDVNADTTVGRIDIGVETDGAAPRSITARSDVGSVRIRTPE